MVAYVRFMRILCFTRQHRDIIQVRWKTFNHFAVNLLKKQCTKFHQNRPCFIVDITEKHSGLFFLNTLYVANINAFTQFMQQLILNLNFFNSLRWSIFGHGGKKWGIRYST